MFILTNKAPPLIFTTMYSLKYELKLFKVVVAAAAFGYLVGRRADDRDFILAVLVIGIFLIALGLAFRWIENFYLGSVALRGDWKTLNRSKKISRSLRQAIELLWLTPPAAAIILWLQIRDKYPIEQSTFGVIVVIAFWMTPSVCLSWIIEELGEAYEELKEKAWQHTSLLVITTVSVLLAFYFSAQFGKAEFESKKNSVAKASVLSINKDQK